MRDVVADLRESGEPVPEPIASRPFSGRFVTRVPSSLHRRLAIEAAEADVSLNRLVSYKLASAADAALRVVRPAAPRAGGRRRAARQLEDV